MVLVEYRMALAGFAALIILTILQWSVASVVKATAADAIPGKISQNLSHDSFVFRTHRTFMNTLENLPVMLATFVLAIFVGVEADITALCIWAFVFFRSIHMLLYYGIATEKNPSVRSYVFLLGLLTNLILLSFCISGLLST